MRQTRVTLIGLLQAAAVITVAFSLITVFPSAHRHIELFCHFRLQYLGASLLLLLVFAALRSPRYSAVLLVAVAVNAGYVVPWYAGGEQADTATATVKLLNANIRSRNQQFDRLIGLIEREQPDLILLQEVTPEWLAELESIREDYPYGHAEPRYDHFGIATFSRLPLDDVSHVDSPPLDYPSIVATLTVNGRMLTIINTHPTIPLGRPRYEARNAQLQSIAEIVKATTGNVILAGDFNTSMWSPAYSALLETTGLRDARRGVGVLPTWPTLMPFAMIPIDHVLVSDDVRVVEIRRGERTGSDHLPLLISFSL